MKVYITGASGFTGKYLSTLLLAENYQVIPGLSNICDVKGLKQELAEVRPDYVIHLAGLSFMAHEDQEAMYRVHIFGSLNILHALQSIKCTPKKIIMASTAQVYGKPNVSVANEKLYPAPLSHYANSKLVMENMVKPWFEHFPIIITRPFNYTGIGQMNNFLIPKIVQHFKRRNAIIELGNIDVIRDFSDVRDVARIYLKLLQSNVKNEIVNICTGRGVALKKIIAIVESLAGYKIEVKQSQQFMRENEVRRLIGSTKKLNQLIGPMDLIPFKETVRWMFHA